MSPDDLNLALLAVTGVLLAGVAAVRISSGIGLPSLLLYLAIGLVIGEAGFGVQFSDAGLTQTLGMLALALILAEGGLTTDWRVVRPVAPLALVLATVGVAVSVTVTSALAYVLLDVELRTAVLLGAVVSSTDAAAVFSVLRQLPIRHRTRAILEAESGFNDPPVIILVTLVVSDVWEELDLLAATLGFLQQLLVGAVVGLVVARGARWVLTKTALPAAGLYPLATLAFALMAFGAAGVAGGSPFLAVYVAALVLGNAELPHRATTLGFAEGLAWLAQIGLFVLLGLLATPGRLADSVVPAIVVGLALTLVARPLSVALCATPFRVPMAEQTFISWAGLRGAVPIVLATLPVTAGLPGAQRIFDVVFLLVVVFTLVQAPVLPTVARRLRVLVPSGTRELSIEYAPFEDLGATMITVDIPRSSRLAGVYVRELRLPGDAAITLILRRHRLFSPGPQTQLEAGDHLLIAANDKHRAAVERRLRAVSRGGRLAGWYGEEGRFHPHRVVPRTGSTDPAGGRRDAPGRPEEGRPRASARWGARRS